MFKITYFNNNSYDKKKRIHHRCEISQVISRLFHIFPLPRYLDQHLQNLFAGAWEERATSPLPITFPTVSSKKGTSG